MMDDIKFLIINRLSSTFYFITTPLIKMVYKYVRHLGDFNFLIPWYTGVLTLPHFVSLFLISYQILHCILF